MTPEPLWAVEFVVVTHAPALESAVADARTLVADEAFDPTYAGPPRANRADEVTPTARARELLALLDELDGCGLAVTDTALLTKHVSTHFGVEPEDVDPDYSAADAEENDEEAE